MSNRVSDRVLQELAFLAALDSVKALIDTSDITEIQDWSGAVVGEFYGAAVKQYLPTANSLLEPSASANPSIAISVSSPVPRVTTRGVDYIQVTASQLIASLSENDGAAWQEFVRRYKPLIASSIVKAAHRMGDDSLKSVDDLVQDVFIKLCAEGSTLKQFEMKHEQAIYGFLKIIAANVVYDYFRSAMSSKRGGVLEKEREARKDPLLTEASDPSTAIEKEVLLKEIDRLLQAFSERDRTVFWLYYRSGLNATEISQRQGIGLTVKGVQSLLFRMRQQIRQALVSPVSERKKRTES